MRRRAGGRPLRSLLALLLGWVVTRVALLVPVPAESSVETVMAPRPPIVLLPTQVRPPFLPVTNLTRYGEPVQPTAFPYSKTTRRPLVPTPIGASRDSDRDTVELLRFIAFAVAFANRHFASDNEISDPAPIPPVGSGSPELPTPPQAAVDPPAERWQAGAWLLWRPGRSPTASAEAGAAAGGQLGGSQAGMRIDYLLAPRSALRPAAYARVTAALKRPHAPEAAAGIAIRPVGVLPVSIGLERRVALGAGGRDAFALLAAGGFGPRPVAAGVIADGYAQAGVVGFRRTDGFVDGRLSLLAPVSRSPLSVGMTLSGGAQPGASRLDIGPEARVRLPLADRAARLSVEWRQRVAGRAAPGSGLAITLAADF